MMVTKLVLIGFLALTVTGCNREVDASVERVRIVIQNKSDSIFWSVDDILMVHTNLTAITDKDVCRSLIDSWVDSLLRHEMDSLSVERRYDYIMSVLRCVDLGVSQTVKAAGYGTEYEWNVKLRVLVWLGVWVKRFRDEAIGVTVIDSKSFNAWRLYEAVAGQWEQFAENMELDVATEAGLWQNGVRTKISTAFEKEMGRRMRAASEIKVRGQYIKATRQRVRAERDEKIQKAKQ